MRSRAILQFVLKKEEVKRSASKLEADEGISMESFKGISSVGVGNLISLKRLEEIAKRSSEACVCPRNRGRNHEAIGCSHELEMRSKAIL